MAVATGREEAAEQVEAQMGIVRNSRLTSYVAAVGDRVAGQAIAA